MANDVRIRKSRIGLRLTRGRLLLAALLGALLLPLGIMALARCHADDHAASNTAAPGLMPLPPTPSPDSQVPVAPNDAGKTTASDDASASQPLPAAPLSTGMPPITLPPPLQPSSERPLPGPGSSGSDQTASLHADVLPLNDWSLHTVSTPTAASKKTPDTGPVTPASAAIADVPAESTSGQSKTSSADELPELPPLEVEGARFKEIQPGVTTSDELIDRWGEGKLRRKNGGVERIFELDHYPKVVVSLQHRRVSAIDVQLDQPTEPETLARRFHFDPDSSVPVVDDAGQPLGQSFPDRGTLFSYDPATKLVSQILIEPIDSQPFLARANYEAELHPGWGLRDVDYALSLDGKQATAHDMRSRMLLAVGRPGDALRSANRSIALAPDNAAFLLNKAAILARLDHRDDALRITRSVAERSDLPALVKARARCQLAELSAGPNGDDKRAIELYMSAIKAAQPLASDEHAAVRRLAKHLLLEAHLGAASDIAWGVWQRKPATVARWIEQADQLAQDLIEHEHADPHLRLDVARLAVSVSAGTDGKWDCTDWIQQALDTGRKLIADADDPLRKQALEWELGAALVDALEVQRTKGLNAESLAHAMAVLRYLQSGIQYRQRTTETTYLLGRAYFQIGMIHAVVDRDHTTAVLWFDRALPFLDRPLPPSAASRIGRHGELLVGMGISYWKTGQHEEALRLTQRGADLMTKAVAMKLLDGGTLAVPYRNLASMHRQMGHSEQARSYSEMAAEHDTLHR